MNKDIINILKNKPYIPYSMEKKIRKDGMLTGSQLWQVITENSDTDILLPPFYDHRDFEQYMAYTGDYFGETFTAIYVKTKQGKLLNLLICHTEFEYLRWKRATMLMVKLNKIPKMHKAFKVKSFRVQQFELLKDMAEFNMTGHIPKENIDVFEEDEEIVF